MKTRRALSQLAGMLLFALTGCGAGDKTAETRQSGRNGFLKWNGHVAVPKK